MLSEQKVTAFCRIERIIKDEFGNDTGERELMWSDEQVHTDKTTIQKIKEFCSGMANDPEFLKNKYSL